jgi:hypothetical protein
VLQRMANETRRHRVGAAAGVMRRPGAGGDA